jgi:hypothetical protein
VAKEGKMDRDKERSMGESKMMTYASDTIDPAAARPRWKRPKGWRLAALAGVLGGVSRVLARRRLGRGRP